MANYIMRSNGTTYEEGKKKKKKTTTSNNTSTGNNYIMRNDGTTYLEQPTVSSQQSGQLAPVKSKKVATTVSNATTNKYSGYTKEQLVEERRKILNRLNKASSGGKEENLLEAFINSALGKDKKNLDSKEYKKYKKQYEEINQYMQDYDVNNTKYSKGIAGHAEKATDVVLGKAEQMTKNLNNRVQSIANSTPDWVGAEKRKLTKKDFAPTYGERLKEKAYQNSKGVERVGLSLLESTVGMIPQAMTAGRAGIVGKVAPIAVGLGNYGGMAYDEARANGYSDKKAKRYGLAVGTLEVGLESLLGGMSSIYGKSAMGNLSNKIMGNIIKNKPVRDLLSRSASEFTEEYLQEFLDPILKNTILGEKNGADFWNHNFKDASKQLAHQFFNKQNLEAGGMGALSAGLLETGDVIQKAKFSKETGRDYNTGYTENEQTVIDKTIEKRLEEKENSEQRTGKERKKIEKEVKEDLEAGKIPFNEVVEALGENRITPQDTYLVESYNDEQNKAKRYEYKGNIDELSEYGRAAVESAKVVANNTKSSQDFVDAMVKMSEDRQMAYKFTTTEELQKNGLVPEGKKANSLYVTNNNGNREVLVNINSSKYLESLLVHETTHDLESNKELYNALKDATENFAVAKGDYNKIRKEVMETYTDKDGHLMSNVDINSEVTARLLEDYLGNEEYISHLTNQKPNLVQKIIDTVKYLKKQFTAGSKEARRLNNLQYKMEQAYKKAYNNQSKLAPVKGNIKYSLIGEVGLKNLSKENNKAYISLNNRLKKAKSMNEKKVSNQEIWLETGWFLDKNNRWKYDLTDKPFSLKEVNIKENTSYKLGDLVEHKALFKLYPELKDITVRIKDYNNKSTNGSYSKNSNEINISNKLLNIQDIEGTLIHEIQHAIQKIEGFEGGSNTRLSRLKYYNSLGEIEASDTKERFINEKYNNYNLDNISPSSVDKNAKHKDLNNYLQNRRTFDKIKDKIFVKDGDSSVQKNQEMDSEKYNRQNRTLVDARIERTSDSSFSNAKYSLTDDQGNKLSKEQQEYFKDSKARDENGNLEVVYHGSERAGFTQFSKNFNFYTNKKSVAKTYTGSNEIVDTRKLESVYDAKSWLKGINENLYIEGNDVYSEVDGEKLLSYNSKEELLDHLKRDIQIEIGNTEAGGIYQGYANIKNPLIVNAHNGKWSAIDIDGIMLDNPKELLDKYGSSTFEEDDAIRTSTTDIVSAIDEARSNGEVDYDGVIFKDIIDEGMFNNDVNDRTPSNVYVTFNSNQFKALDNTTPTNDADIRYSLSKTGEMVDNTGKKVTLETSDTGTSGTLMAIHNLSEDKMKGILELGGFPVPSIAITNPSKVKHDGYGNISVLFSKNTIDPTINGNEVYDRDVWSPRFPDVAREISSENVDKVAKEIGISESSLQSLAEDYSNPESLVYRLSRDTDIVEKYLKDNNIEVSENDNYRKVAEENGIIDYLNKQVDGIYGKKGIYNGESYLTDDGRRRTFWEMHDEYNLENVVKNLINQDTVSSETSVFGRGFGNIQANMSNQYNTIEDIKNNESKIMNQEDVNATVQPIIDELNNEMQELGELYGENFDPLWDMDSVNYQLQEFSKLKELTSDGFYDIANEFNPTLAAADINLVNRIIDTMNKIKTIPTDYFEAKPQRSVGFDEVQAMVIPNNLDTDFKQQLLDAGLKYYEYDPSMDGDRQRVINQFDDLKFSLSNESTPLAYDRNKTRGEDVRYGEQIKNTIEPLRQEIQQLTQTINEIRTQPQQGNTIAEEKTNNDEVLTIRPDRKQYSINKRVQKAIENSSYKGIKEATAEADKYIKFTTQERRTFKDALSKYAGMTKEDFTNVNNYREIEAIVENFANREYNYVDTELKSMKDQVRNTKIKITDDLKNRITDYNDFRKSNFGKLKLGNEGQYIDDVWAELSGTHPEYFSENITNEEDMLYALSDFMNEDINLTEQFRLSDEDIEIVRDKVFNTLAHNQLRESDINELQTELDKVVERKKRTVVQENLLHEMNITREDIQKGNDISAPAYQRTDPVRLHEKVFGYETGKKINDATVYQVKHNEAERIRFLNKERDEIKALGIKPRSKESAAVQKYAEKEYINEKGEYSKYGDRELAKEFTSVMKQNKIKKAAAVLRAKYDTYIDSVNEVLVDMGYDPIPKRDNYMKHFYELTDKFSQWGVPFNRNDMRAEDLPTDINGITDEFKPGKSWFASAMERKGMSTVYDAITGIDTYIDGASNLIYHTEDIQRYRTLSKFIREEYGQQHGLDNIENMSEEEIEERLSDIQDHKLSKYVAWLDEQANALAGKKGKIDRAAERLLGRKAYTALNTLKQQVGSNMTGFNVRSAMTNFASAIQGASKTNKLGFIQGTISTVKNIIHKDNLIDKSDFLTNRFGSDNISKKAWQKAINAGQIFMTGTDYFTANQIWRGKYYENLNKGMSEKDAIKNADDFASRIMGDRTKGQTAEIFNSKTLGLLTQFQLEVNNQWSSLIHDNKIDIQSGNKSGAMVVFQLGQLFGLSYLFNSFMKSVTGSKVMIDPIDLLKKIFGADDDKEKTLEQRAEETLGSLVDDIPFASVFTGGRIPIGEAFTGVETLAKKMTNQTDKYGNKYTWGNVKDDAIESAFYLLLPTGYGQAKKAVKGMSMYSKKHPVAGSYTDSGNLRFEADTSGWGKTKAFLFGQYASKSAQDYINRDYSSVDKDKLKEMKKIGLSADEYTKLKTEITQATKTQDDKKNYKYYDENGKLYYYNKDKDIVYDSKYKKTSIDIGELDKAKRKELLEKFLKSKKGLTSKQKEYLLENTFKGGKK